MAGPGLKMNTAELALFAASPPPPAAEPAANDPAGSATGKAPPGGVGLGTPSWDTSKYQASASPGLVAPHPTPSLAAGAGATPAVNPYWSPYMLGRGPASGTPGIGPLSGPSTPLATCSAAPTPATPFLRALSTMRSSGGSSSGLLMATAPTPTSAEPAWGSTSATAAAYAPPGPGSGDMSSGCATPATPAFSMFGMLLSPSLTDTQGREELTPQLPPTAGASWHPGPGHLAEDPVRPVSPMAVAGLAGGPPMTDRFLAVSIAQHTATAEAEAVVPAAAHPASGPAGRHPTGIPAMAMVRLQDYSAGQGAARSGASPSPGLPALMGGDALNRQLIHMRLTQQQQQQQQQQPDRQESQRGADAELAGRQAAQRIISAALEAAAAAGYRADLAAGLPADPLLAFPLEDPTVGGASPVPRYIWAAPPASQHLPGLDGLDAGDPRADDGRGFGDHSPGTPFRTMDIEEADRLVQAFQASQASRQAARPDPGPGGAWSVGTARPRTDGMAPPAHAATVMAGPPGGRPADPVHGPPAEEPAKPSGLANDAPPAEHRPEPLADGAGLLPPGAVLNSQEVFLTALLSTKSARGPPPVESRSNAARAGTPAAAGGSTSAADLAGQHAGLRRRAGAAAAAAAAHPGPDALLATDSPTMLLATESPSLGHLAGGGYSRPGSVPPPPSLTATAAAAGEAATPAAPAVVRSGPTLFDQYGRWFDSREAQSPRARWRSFYRVFAPWLVFGVFLAWFVAVLAQGRFGRQLQAAERPAIRQLAVALQRSDAPWSHGLDRLRTAYQWLDAILAGPVGGVNLFGTPGPGLSLAQLSGGWLPDAVIPVSAGLEALLAVLMFTWDIALPSRVYIYLTFLRMTRQLLGSMIGGAGLFEEDCRAALVAPFESRVALLEQLPLAACGPESSGLPSAHLMVATGMLLFMALHVRKQFVVLASLATVGYIGAAATVSVLIGSQSVTMAFAAVAYGASYFCTYLTTLVGVRLYKLLDDHFFRYIMETEKDPLELESLMLTAGGDEGAAMAQAAGSGSSSGSGSGPGPGPASSGVSATGGSMSAPVPAAGLAAGPARGAPMPAPDSGSEDKEPLGAEVAASPGGPGPGVGWALGHEQLTPPVLRFRPRSQILSAETGQLSPFEAFIQPAKQPPGGASAVASAATALAAAPTAASMAAPASPKEEEEEEEEEEDDVDEEERKDILPEIGEKQATFSIPSRPSSRRASASAEPGPQAADSAAAGGGPGQSGYFLAPGGRSTVTVIAAPAGGPRWPLGGSATAAGAEVKTVELKPPSRRSSFADTDPSSRRGSASGVAGLAAMPVPPRRSSLGVTPADLPASERPAALADLAAATMTLAPILDSASAGDLVIDKRLAKVASGDLAPLAGASRPPSAPSPGPGLAEDGGPGPRQEASSEAPATAELTSTADERMRQRAALALEDLRKIRSRGAAAPGPDAATPAGKPTTAGATLGEAAAPATARADPMAGPADDPRPDHADDHDQEVSAQAALFDRTIPVDRRLLPEPSLLRQRPNAFRAQVVFVLAVAVGVLERVRPAEYVLAPGVATRISTFMVTLQLLGLAAAFLFRHLAQLHLRKIPFRPHYMLKDSDNSFEQADVPDGELAMPPTEHAVRSRGQILWGVEQLRRRNAAATAAAGPAGPTPRLGDLRRMRGIDLWRRAVIGLLVAAGVATIAWVQELLMHGLEGYVAAALTLEAGGSLSPASLLLAEAMAALSPEMATFLAIVIRSARYFTLPVAMHFFVPWMVGQWTAAVAANQWAGLCVRATRREQQQQQQLHQQPGKGGPMPGAPAQAPSRRGTAMAAT
ncbi:hypothetical protein H696_04517 [Fonticula alba]|uniref:Uncharacterized protein n=1 Tax=Fonticula alba TaxID=691883 RepID=A0A058Z4P9_FONAL|nr:hypothetical protein H696_04517 [Fonticula alba]KCV69101.1 hypothetical protein H696_04517 [Fonticula alba]|eukprot:XP_009496672.1 hypothetical protein H696_04517 [Fonticula alba]